MMLQHLPEGRVSSQSTEKAVSNLAARPLRVVHAVLSLDVGGLERIVLDLVRQGRGTGQNVTVLCLERPGTLAPQAEDLGARVVCVHKKPGKQLGTIGQLRKAFREVLPDIVHTHQVGVLCYAGPAARWAGVPVVVHTEHGQTYGVRLRTRLLGRLAGRFVARFFCVSRDIANEVAACRIVSPDKIVVVANGIDTDAFDQAGDPRAVCISLDIPVDAPLIGTLGRLSEIKRQDLLIRAVVPLDGVHLLLVGDGPLMAALRELAEKLGVRDRVHFAGYQTRPEAYLRAMDVFALTSRSEGMPLAVLEAWAAGLPVVASDVGGVPELIDHGKTGIIFPSGDELSLTQALRSLLKDRDQAKRLGESGRERVRASYSLERMAADYESHYHKLLSRKLGVVACES